MTSSRTTSVSSCRTRGRCNPKLTLNLGIRTESEDVPSYRADNPGVHFGFGDKIAPRVGFAYDVKGDSR